MILVAVQCRLSSTRLPGKAILPLGGKTVLDWCLASMKKVTADEYYVATDKDSYETLAPICERNGFKCYQGSLNDVLDRYCSLIEKTNADIVIRATADNPFLFYEAASSLLEQFIRRSETSKCDYITWTGLPHGSGVEIFSAASLLKARKLTDLPYDHEHVGPSLYNHPENFTSLFIPAPEQWNFPQLRTTIDTASDYRRACRIVDYVSSGTAAEPYDCKTITDACGVPHIARPVLLIPSVSQGHGTGHLHRCLQLATQLNCDVYIPEDASLEDVPWVLENAFGSGLKKWQVRNTLPQKDEYALIVSDSFETDTELLKTLSSLGTLCAIDEGNKNNSFTDYLLDVIPSVESDRYVNYSCPSFIDLPRNTKKGEKPSSSDQIRNILVCCGGEDPAGLVVPACVAFAAAGKTVTGIVKNPEEACKKISGKEKNQINFILPVSGLKEKLFEYDLVVTHYGLTAFEALAAGCGVILLGTSGLHVKLAQKYGFAHLKKSEITAENALKILKDVTALYPQSPALSGQNKNTLAGFISQLARGRKFACPVCQDKEKVNPVAARIPQRTFSRCKDCGMLYMSWTIDEENTDYNEAYFFDDYKKQYGKTYLEDFESIKSQCVRRCGEVDSIFRKNNKGVVTPSVMDIGCAFGPYLDAASDAGWQVFGTDISKEAVEYVQNKLHYAACVSSFPVFDSETSFGVRNFDAVTMWYVIEHFQNLDAVLKTVSKLVKTGGVFAFSTPSAGGVSGTYNRQSFFTNSPSDHYTLWEPSKAASILKKYGFRLVKTVVTGHHPERFPALKNKPLKGFKFWWYSLKSRIFGLGDTFEVYCVKEKDIFK